MKLALPKSVNFISLNMLSDGKPKENFSHRQLFVYFKNKLKPTIWNCKHLIILDNRKYERLLFVN